MNFCHGKRAIKMKTETIAQAFARTMIEIEDGYNIGTDYARRLMIDGAKLMLNSLGYEAEIHYFGDRNYSERHVTVTNRNENEKASVVLSWEYNTEEG